MLPAQTSIIDLRWPLFAAAVRGRVSAEPATGSWKDVVCTTASCRSMRARQRWVRSRILFVRRLRIVTSRIWISRMKTPLPAFRIQPCRSRGLVAAIDHPGIDRCITTSWRDLEPLGEILDRCARYLTMLGRQLARLLSSAAMRDAPHTCHRFSKHAATARNDPARDIDDQPTFA
jgi:hypothetical protein